MNKPTMIEQEKVDVVFQVFRHLGKTLVEREGKILLINESGSFKEWKSVDECISTMFDKYVAHGIIKDPATNKLRVVEL